MYTSFRTCFRVLNRSIPTFFLSLALYLALFSSTSLWAQSNPSIPQIMSKGHIIKATGKGSLPVLSSIGNENGAEAKDGTPLRMELLALFPSTIGEKGLQDRLISLVMASAAPKSLGGLQYWSASRRLMRTLYSKAYMVVGKNDTREIPDPVSLVDLGKGPPWKFFAYLQDLTFGGNIFEFETTIAEGSLVVAITNAETLRYALMPLAKPGGMIQRITATPYAEGLLVHCVTLLYAPDFLARRVFESAGNKTLALLGWFAGRIEAVGYGTPQPWPVNIEDVASVK